VAGPGVGRAAPPLPATAAPATAAASVFAAATPPAAVNPAFPYGYLPYPPPAPCGSRPRALPRRPTNLVLAVEQGSGNARWGSRTS
jgi:hypothetical protein